MLDKILKPYGLEYEDLNQEERATLHVMVDAMGKGGIDINKIREYISSMRESVALDLVSMTDTSSQKDKMKDVYLKARLHNYVLLEAILDKPNKTSKAIESMLAGMVSKVDK